VFCRRQQPSEILLGMKKRGFGMNKWNGFGGKVEVNETIPQAAARELQEECGLDVDIAALAKRGLLRFQFTSNMNLVCSYIILFFPQFLVQFSSTMFADNGSARF
jgi:8-oxo-dGTP pyrophosphatase MutT (NUDIX family)